MAYREIGCLNFHLFKNMTPILKDAVSSTCKQDETLYFPSAKPHMFLLVLEGNIHAEIENRTYTIRKGNLLMVRPGMPCTIRALTNVSYIALHFEIYVDSNHIQEPWKPLNEGAYLIPEIELEEAVLFLPENPENEDNGYTYLLIEKIYKEFHSKGNGSEMLIKSLLIELLVNFLRKSKLFDTVLQNCDSVSISSHADNGIFLKKGRMVWITDVEIWSGQTSGNLSDNKEENGQLLSVMYVDNKYVEIPNDYTVFSFTILENENPPLGKSVGELHAYETCPYKIWFFQPSQMPPLDLRPYKDTGFIKFYVKSNMVGSLGFSLYTRKNYTSINISVDVDHTNAWVSVKLPISSMDSGNPVSANVTAAIEYIKGRYTQKIKLPEIAQHVHLHPSYLCNIFKKETGMPIMSFIRNYRITMAKNLLLETNYKVEEIAYRTGFYDLHHFSRVFKEDVGFSPAVYRQARGAMNNK